MKVPTVGTQVFSVNAIGSGSTGTSNGLEYADTIIANRNRFTASFGQTQFFDRLRGVTTTTSRKLVGNTTAAETTITPGSSGNAETGAVMNNNYMQMQFGGNITLLGSPGTDGAIGWWLKRATGFMDVVCFIGNDTNRTISHNLGVAPELMIVKARNLDASWRVYAAPLTATSFLGLNQTAAAISSSSVWNNTTPTSSVFSLGTSVNVNASPYTYVAYLFATLAGVSKVGSYTGNGSSQTINCGFTAGARFVLIKRTDSNGDWVTLDTARGIVSGNDPFLQLNSTAAEITNEDIVDPANSGFIVNETTEAINTNAATYIFLAIA
jgi:hypothetical protein